MPVISLTDLSVNALKSVGKQAKYFDKALPAFGIRVGKKRKTFVVMTGTDRKLISIGHYPTLSLANARREARKILAGVMPEPATDGVTFSEIRTQFISQHPGRESSKRELNRLLTKHGKSLDAKALVDIRPADLDTIIDKLRDRPGECLHFWRAARTFFRWCARRRLLSQSPLTDEPPAKEKVGDRVLTDEEIKAIWKATADGSPFSRIVRLLLITAQRRGPIASLRKEWITSEGILFPASIMKAGKEFLLPITPLAAAELPDRDGYLFPARGSDRPFSGFGESKADLDRRCGVSGWTLHSLRRTAATNMGKLKVQPHIIQSVLAHSWGGITARYNRFDYYNERKVALQDWGKELIRIVK
jgi:integrase